MAASDPRIKLVQAFEFAGQHYETHKSALAAALRSDLEALACGWLGTATLGPGHHEMLDGMIRDKDQVLAILNQLYNTED